MKGDSALRCVPWSPQQYFYEYQFDEIRTRPRQVCPYAIVSFIYQGNAALPAPKPAPPLR